MPTKKIYIEEAQNEIDELQNELLDESLPKAKETEIKNKLNMLGKMIKHSKHHTVQQMRILRDEIKKGKTFDQAHEIAVAKK